jgi:hypothetical protein
MPPKPTARRPLNEGEPSRTRRATSRQLQRTLEEEEEEEELDVEQTEDHTQDDIESESEDEIRNRIAEVERLLLQEQERARKKAELRERLRAAEAELQARRTNQIRPDVVSPPTARSNASLNTRQEPLVRTKELQPKDLREYWGKTIREHREWVSSAKNAFRLAPTTFRDDVFKISFATQFLRGTPYTSWTEKERQMTASEVTWDSFETYLINLIEDPANRQLEALQQYMDARQRRDQTVQAFNSFLLSLEDQLDERYTPSQLRGHLWCKLRPDMRSNLSNYQEIPQTRDGLVTLATRIENNKRRATLTQLTGDREIKRSRPEERTSSPRPLSTFPNHFRTPPNSNPIANPNPNRMSTNLNPPRPTEDRRCYNCNRTGHVRHQCPDLVKEIAVLDTREATIVDTRESEEELGNDSAS